MKMNKTETLPINVTTAAWVVVCNKCTGNNVNNSAYPICSGIEVSDELYFVIEEYTTLDRRCNGSNTQWVDTLFNNRYLCEPKHIRDEQDQLIKAIKKKLNGYGYFDRVHIFTDNDRLTGKSLLAKWGSILQDSRKLLERKIETIYRTVCENSWMLYKNNLEYRIYIDMDKSITTSLVDRSLPKHTDGKLSNLMVWSCHNKNSYEGFFGNHDTMMLVAWLRAVKLIMGNDADSYLDNYRIHI